MKTEQLKEIGLSKEQIDEVMKLNGIAIQNVKDKFEGIEEQLDATKNTLQSYEDQLAELEEKAKDNEEFSKAITEYKTKIQELEETKEKELMQVRKESQIKTNILANYNVHNVEDVFQKIDLEHISIDGDTLIGFNEQMEKVKELYPYQFKTETEEPIGTGGSLGNNRNRPTPPKLSKEEFESMTFFEKAELKQENPEEYNRLIKGV